MRPMYTLRLSMCTTIDNLTCRRDIFNITLVRVVVSVDCLTGLYNKEVWPLTLISVYVIVFLRKTVL